MSNEIFSKFAVYVAVRSSKNTGYSAQIRRGDNEDTEEYAWPHIAQWVCSVSKETGMHDYVVRRAFCMVGAAVARTGNAGNGLGSIARSLLHAYGYDRSSGPANARLRRLLSCDSREELLEQVHHVLRLLESKGASVNYGKLLSDIVYFNDHVKETWAEDFYAYTKEPANA